MDQVKSLKTDGVIFDKIHQLLIGPGWHAIKGGLVAVQHGHGQFAVREIQ